MFPGILVGIVPLAVIALIVMAVIAVVRRRSEDDELDPGIGSLRRFFYYGLALVALSVAGTGIVILLTILLDAILGDDIIVSRGQTRLALGLALTLVGAPVWGILWTQIQKASREYEVESRSFGRKLYVYLVMGIAAAVAAAPAVLTLRWLMGIRDFSAVTLAIPLVMLAIWLFHRKAFAADPAGRGTALLVRPLYVYITSLYALGMLATGVGLVLFRYFVEAYDAAFETLLVGGAFDFWPRQAREGLALALVGGGWWTIHWFWFAKSDREPWIRQAYLDIAAAIGGAITVTVSLAIFTFGILEWAFAAREFESASEHFRFIPGTAAGLAVGIVLWGYHASIIKTESKDEGGWHFSALRGYQYLVTGAGLATLAAGQITIVGAALGLIFPDTPDMITSENWWRSPLAAGISMAIVGGALWGWFWPSLQKAAAANTEEERERLSRRVFMYGVFCISALITLGDLSGLLFIFLRDLLEGSLNAETFQDTKWLIATLITTSFFSVYYGMILREDRRARKAGEAEGAPVSLPARGKRVTVMGGPETKEIARRLERSIGQPVTFWRTAASGAAAALDYAEIVDLIAKTPGDRVLVIFENGAARVVPYELD